MDKGRRSVGACPDGYQEGIPAGSCCTGAASLPDCDLERAVICDDEDGFWAQHCTKVYEHDRSQDHTRDRMPAVDNYVDDLKAPSKNCPDVASKLAEHGIHCDFKLAMTRKSRPCRGTLRVLI